MIATKGDIVSVRSGPEGENARKGLVLSALGTILKIRWEDDSESMFIPGPGTLTVVGHETQRELVDATH